jgi:hypothetical protein
MFISLSFPDAAERAAGDYCVTDFVVRPMKAGLK